jgi:hypothetical protein
MGKPHARPISTRQHHLIGEIHDPFLHCTVAQTFELDHDSFPSGTSLGELDERKSSTPVILKVDRHLSKDLHQQS